MSFKGHIWDLMKSSELENSLSQDLPTVLVVKSNFFEKIISDFYKSINPNTTSVWGHQITASWVNQNFSSYDLFGGSSVYVIHEINNKTNKDVQEQLKKQIDDGVKSLYVFQNKTILKNFKIDKTKVNLMEIEAPRQWHLDKLLSFYKDYFQLKNIQLNHFSQLVDWPIEDYLSLYQILNQFNLELGANPQVKLDIKFFKSHSFQVLDFFCFKKLGSVFSYFLEMVENDEQGVVFQLLALIRGTIIKCSDENFLNDLKTQSKYNDKLKKAKNLYSIGEFSALMKELSVLELSLKEGKSKAIDVLHTYLLKYKSL